MLDRRWLWTAPVYVVLVITVIVALRTAWEKSPVSAQGEQQIDQSGLLVPSQLSFGHLPRFTCRNRSWLGVVSSAPHHFYHRKQIRLTWAYQQQVVFLLGQADPAHQPMIDREADEFGDIVQGSFIDSYRNLTYKHIMGLSWARKHCPNGGFFILKTDDDVFVNTPYLQKYLPSLSDQRLIFCPLMEASLVKRSYRSKWRVTPEEYSGRWYPPYCAGWVILYSSDAAYSIYEKALREPYFWIDDVHITGTIAEKLNLTHTPVGALGIKEKATEILLTEKEPQMNFLFSLTDPTNFLKLWTMVSDIPPNDIVE